MTQLSFGQKLMILRKNKKLSQKQLAEQLKIGVATVARYETDSRTANRDVLLKLSEYFGVSLDYLVKENEADYSSIQDKDFEKLLFEADTLKELDRNTLKNMIKPYIESHKK